MKLPDLRTLVEVMLALATVAGAVFASPMLLSKARLIRERDDALRYATLLEKRLVALGGGADVADSIVERLSAEVRELRAEVVETRKTQVVSTRYVADLVLHVRRRGTVATMPAAPPEISDNVLAEIRARENDATASTQGAAGVLVAAQGASA